jgi:hypothetical protein
MEDYRNRRARKSHERDRAQSRGGANFATTYAYDGPNHLTTVSLTRPEGTQTRTFQYSGPGLTSATNPEKRHHHLHVQQCAPGVSPASTPRTSRRRTLTIHTAGSAACSTASEIRGTIITTLPSIRTAPPLTPGAALSSVKGGISVAQESACSRRMARRSTTLNWLLASVTIRQEQRVRARSDWHRQDRRPYHLS